MPISTYFSGYEVFLADLTVLVAGIPKLLLNMLQVEPDKNP
jgi:hypothetical protein